MQTVVAMREAKAPDAPATPSPVAAEPASAAAASRPHPAPAPRTAFLPLLLGLLALTASLGHQAWLLDQDRQQLQAAQAGLQPTVEKAGGLRQSLDRLAADTQRLADAGNGNARVLVDELRKRGITINPGTVATPNPAATNAPGPTGR